MGIETVVAAVVTGIGAGTTFTAAAGLTLGFSFVAAATSLALGALATALAPKPKNSQGSAVSGFSNASGSFAARAEGLTQNVRQAVTARRTLYGEARIGGTINFLETSNSDRYLHMVISLVDHEVDGIGEIWFDNVSIPPDAIDGNGNVNSGIYSGKARIKKYYGTADQTADPDLVAETSVDDTFRGRGVAYLYIRLDYDSDVFPSQIPVVTTWVRGKKLYDTRDAGTRWTPNAALIANDYLTEPLTSLTPGIGADQSDVDSTELNSSANICEEMVTVTALNDTVIGMNASTDTLTLSGVNSRLQYQTGDRVQLSGDTIPTGLSAATNYYVIPHQRRDTLRIKLASSLANAIAGTAIDISGSASCQISKNAEPRYFGGGVVETSVEPKENFDDIMTAMSGSAVYVGGQWKILAGSYRTPVFSFDENHILSKIVVRPKVSRKDRFNQVKGLYVAPINDGQPQDYPYYTNSTYVTQDGRALPTDFDLPMTQRPHTAQRLSKIKLEKHRQEIFFEADFSLHACQVQPGDVVNINVDRMGWSSKPFEVIKWSLEQKEINGSPLFYVKMSLQETATTVYDWNNGEETAVDPAPDTNLPNPFVVGIPGAPEVTEELFLTRAGAGVKVKATLISEASTDPFVAGYQFRYKQVLQPDTEYITLPTSTDNKAILFDVSPGTYQFECRTVNQIGVKSAWIVNNNVEILGLSAPPAAITNLSIQAISSFAILRWSQTTDLDVLEGGKVVFRHSPATSGATWSTSTSIGDAVPGRATETVLPLKAGSYLVRFYDSSGIPSPVTVVTTKAATILAFADVDTIEEHPNFTGTYTNMVKETSVSPNVIKLGGAGEWDDIVDFDAEPDIDLFGGLSTSGSYRFSGGIDLGSVQRVRLEATLKTRIVDELDNFDEREGNIDSWADFDGDGDDVGSADATVWVRETDDDPSASPTWSDWQRLDVGEYNARGFEFEIRAETDDPAYNIYIEEATITAKEIN